jgi:ligand-binding sensor domain-containing protein
MNRSLIIYILLFAVFFIRAVSAQNNIVFSHLTVDNGLSQSSVTCIFQDKKGFMWFGTQDGLNRYDGYRFKTYKNIPSDKNTLKENFIFSIYESSKGILYVETQDGTLHRFNSRSETFTIVNKDNIDLANARGSSINARLEESSGIVWSGSLGKPEGLKRLDKKSGRSTTFKHNPKDPHSLSDDKVYSVTRDHKGNLWVGTFNGLDRLDEKSGRFIHYRNIPGSPASLPDNWVWPVYEDSKNNLWIGTVRGGLAKYDRSSDTFTSYKNIQNDPASLNDNFIFSIYEDRGGVIWIGTNLGGINYLHPSTQVFEQYKYNASVKNSLSDNIVLSMLVDRNGDYWIGTRKGGLNKYDHKTKKFTYLNNIPGNASSLVSNSVQSLLEDRYGNIWIGTFSDGLDIYDPSAGTFKHLKQGIPDTASLTDNRIYALAEDKFSNIWIGTYAGGLNKYDRNTGKISAYLHNSRDTTSLSSNAVWSMTFDDSGILWIGTFGEGINVFNPAGKKFIHFKNIPGNSKSIADNNIIRVFKDKAGNMWFGTTRGFSRYVKPDNSFKNYSVKDGLANNYVYGILEDKRGNLWLSTNNGLSKFDPVKETFKNYLHKDGLQGNEFNQNAFAKDRQTGKLLFGGPNGYNVFDPEKLVMNQYKPPVVFTGYTRYNTDDSEGKPIIENGISERDSILLSYKDNIITLEFSALSFFNNAGNQYKYILEGFNKNWIQLGSNHTVTFTNLSPGKYTLKVLGSNNDGLWNEKAAAITIEVTPPWWRTWIAYSIYTISFLLILYRIRKFEINRREQKIKVRETELHIKAAEAEKKLLEVENERKSKELEEARLLQISMLPRELPESSSFKLAAFMRPATEAGGDYYDFIFEEDGTLNIAFGDATGHGLQAGTMVTLMKAFFTSDSTRLGLQEFMSSCNRMIKNIKPGRLLMSFSFLKIKNYGLCISSAGMPPVFYYNSREDAVEEILIPGLPLGGINSFEYNIVERNLNPGDTILLLTDGLPEQMNKDEEMFNYTQVKSIFSEAAVKNPDKIIEALLSAGDKWMDGLVQSDDISFVVIRIK